jgi:hypothetical protein
MNTTGKEGYWLIVQGLRPGLNDGEEPNYFSEAVRERIAREKREKALREILAAKPTFTDAKDGTTFVRELRSVDKKRDERLGLL